MSFQSCKVTFDLTFVMQMQLYKWSNKVFESPQLQQTSPRGSNYSHLDDSFVHFVLEIPVEKFIQAL